MARYELSRIHPPDDVIDAWKSATITVDIDGDSSDPQEVARSTGGTVHVLTAWNPGGIAQSQEENDRATQELELRLVELGARFYPATGSEVASSWQEAGFAILGRSRDEMRTLGVSFGQVALYESTREATLIVWCAQDLVMDRST